MYLGHWKSKWSPLSHFRVHAQKIFSPGPFFSNFEYTLMEIFYPLFFTFWVHTKEINPFFSISRTLYVREHSVKKTPFSRNLEPSCVHICKWEWQHRGVIFPIQCKIIGLFYTKMKLFCCEILGMIKYLAYIVKENKTSLQKKTVSKSDQ